MKRCRIYLLAGIVGMLCGCTGEVENLFSTDPAYLRVSPVTAVEPLRVALTSPGEFCTITIEPTRYVFTRPNGSSAPLNRTDEETYGRPVYRAGFLVGTPSLPDEKTGQFYYVCYELACPDCYTNRMLTKAMKLQEGEIVACPECGRSYSLLYGGSQIGGEKGKRLMKRYNCTYTPAYDNFEILN